MAIDVVLFIFQILFATMKILKIVSVFKDFLKEEYMSKYLLKDLSAFAVVSGA